MKYVLRLGILELADQTELEIRLSSLETKYVRMYYRLEDVEKRQTISKLKITESLEIYENTSRNLGKEGTLTRQMINKIGNQTKEIKQDIKERQNFIDTRLDDIENKTRVHDALISNLTDGRYSVGMQVCVCVCVSSST